MDKDELEIKKFELEQKVKLEELEIKKKELDLRIQEQKNKRISTPLILSILGGVITIITGIIVNHYDNQFKIELEEKKFQSSLLLKATDQKSYEAFSDMLVTLQENGLLSLDSTKIAKFRKKKFVTVNTNPITSKDTVSSDNGTVPKQIQDENGYIWTVIAGADTKLDAATYEKNRARKKGFEDVSIWYRKNSYRTCIGKFGSREKALHVLFDVKEKMNQTAYIVQLEKWCPNAIYDKERLLYNCP